MLIFDATKGKFNVFSFDPENGEHDKVLSAMMGVKQVVMTVNDDGEEVKAKDQSNAPPVVQMQEMSYHDFLTMCKRLRQESEQKAESQQSA